MIILTNEHNFYELLFELFEHWLHNDGTRRAKMLTRFQGVAYKNMSPCCDLFEGYILPSSVHLKASMLNSSSVLNARMTLFSKAH